MKVTPLGDSALTVRVRDQFADAPEQTLEEVLFAFRHLRDAAIAGVIELAPAYTTVAVFFDPARVVEAGAKPAEIFDWLTERIVAALANRGRREKHAKSSTCSVNIPVCYDPDFALDLDHVAQNAGISASEVVDLHCAAEYRVTCIGFTPGFPFMAGLSTKLTTPRRGTPRKGIPAGSVAIGGAQTGIYPLPSPGGWNIIGRTPLRLFDPAKNPPALLQAGDRVRFRRITRDEFQAFNR